MIPEAEESGKIPPPHNKRAFSSCLLQALKGGLQKDTAPSCCKAFEHRQLMEGRWDGSKIPGPKFWVCVTAATLETPMGRARLSKCSPCALCRFVFWGKAIQNLLLPSTLPINSLLLLLLFFQQSTELFSKSGGAQKNQVPCTVVSLGHRMQRFIVRGHYPFPLWILSANVSVTLCERLMQTTLPQSQSLQRK